MARLAAGEEKIGSERLERPSRFASQAPNIGQTISSALNACVAGCLLDDESDPGDVVGLQMIAQDCGNAAVVLDDLEEEIRASRGPWAP